MKRQVMNLAWQVCRKFASFSDALVYAWKVVKLRIAMMLGVVKFEYRKVDGYIRQALGTLQVPTAAKGQSSSEVFTYYDIDADGWRSAKICNFIF